MKKPEKNNLAEKALKLKENIRLPQVKFPIGNHSKKKDEGEKTVSKEDADLQAASISKSGYQRGNLQGSPGQTGALYGSGYRREASEGSPYQTGMLPGNTYTQRTARSSRYQTGAISGNTYTREQARSSLYQNGTISGNTYTRESARSGLYQTGTLAGNVYHAGNARRNLYQTGAPAGNAYGTGTVRRNKGQSGRAADITASEDFLQRKRRQSGGEGETLRRTGASAKSQRQSDGVQADMRGANVKAAQRKRRQTKAFQEDTQQGGSGRNSREDASSRRNASQTEENVKGLPKIPGAAAVYIKIALVAVLLLFVIFDLSDEPDSAVKLETVEQNVVEAAGLESSEPAEARMIKRFYGLNPKDYDGAVLYAPADNMDAHELFLVKLKDDTQKKAVEDAIEERLDTQLKSFEGYGAEQTALLEGHVLSEKGNYMLYIVGEYAEDAQKAFAESL